MWSVVSYNACAYTVSYQAAKVTADDIAYERGDERERYRVTQIAHFGFGKVNCGNVEHRFARTVNDGRASSDKTVSTVSGIDVFQHRKTARTRQRSEQNELAQLSRDTDEFERGRHEA